MNPIRRFCNWYFSRSALPYWCVMAMDCAAVFVAGIFAFYLNYGAVYLLNNFWSIVFGLCVCLIAFVASFIGFHTYRGVMRYSSFIDLNKLSYSGICAYAVVCLLHQIQVHTGLFGHLIIPRFYDAILMFIISTVIMWSMRVLMRTLHDMYRLNDTAQNIFIYGCLAGGIAIAKSVLNENPRRYVIKGFISGDDSMVGSFLMSTEVYSDDDSVLEIMQQKSVKAVLVSPYQAERFTNRTSLVNGLIKAGIKIQMMPIAEEWDGKSDFSHVQLKEVDIEELLPRQKIEVDMIAIGSMLRGKRILITGAAGSIGFEIVRQVAKFSPAEMILVDQAESPMHNVRLFMAKNYPYLEASTIVGSISNKTQMETIFSEHKPEYVFHAAAYKHVPMMEDNPSIAVQNNIYGTRVIADLAVKYGTLKFVMISTDKAVNPTNVMGCSKRICEIYCQSLNREVEMGNCKMYDGKTAVTQFVTTRFGNVLGSNGSVIPIFREQILRGGPVTVTHPDIIRFFMLIPEACRLVLEAGTMGKGGEIFVFDMGSPVRIVDLAQRMIELMGAKDVKIQFTGLRDGEKLYEEVLNVEEETKPTIHPKIKIAAVREYPYQQALANEEELYKLSFSYDDMAVVAKMKEIVPEYKSQHSKYSSLDN